MRISDWSSDVCSSDLLLPLRADALAVGFERGKLVLEDHLAVVKQASDQRRLAVIDRAAGDEAQQRLLLMPRELSVDILGNEGVGDVVGVRSEARGGGKACVSTCRSRWSPYH